MLRVVSKKAPLWGAFLFVGTMQVQAACPPPDSAQNIRVEQVYDGDTVRLTTGQSVRFIGVNTPEMNYKRGSPEVGALAAKQYVQSRLSQMTRLQSGTQQRDRYGRLLAHIYLNDGLSLEEQLLERGLGYYLAIPPNLFLRECLKAAESRARTHRLGLWRNGSWPQHVAELKPHSAGFVILQGKISKISRTKKAWYLELNDRVALKVSADVLALFDDAQMTKMRLKGKVEVRGWMIDRSARSSVTKKGYKPLFISVSHPDHLLFLSE